MADFHRRTETCIARVMQEQFRDYPSQLTDISSFFLQKNGFHSGLNMKKAFRWTNNLLQMPIYTIKSSFLEPYFLHLFRSLLDLNIMSSGVGIHQSMDNSPNGTNIFGISLDCQVERVQS